MKAPATIEPLAVSVKVAASICSVSARTITRAVKGGELSRCRFGRHFVYRIVDLHGWLANHLVPHLEPVKTRGAKPVKRKIVGAGVDRSGQRKTGKTR